MVKTLGNGDRTDFDETLRLLYMALLVGRTKRYNLVGTLVLALKHHHGVDLDADEIADHLVGLVEQEPTKAEDEAWVREQITRITAELGG
ncbi:MAG TPA: hypothetical protein VGL33_30390 [Streptosporangiaceae bacterium]|jgi:hypothetical protein